jgi:hypothetical protein
LIRWPCSMSLPRKLRWSSRLNARRRCQAASS